MRIDLEPALTMTLYQLDGDTYAQRAGGVPGEPLHLAEPIQASLDPAAIDAG